ncbi:MAG: hypothetical protein HQK50_08480 [Oligoflexia bacterium]|nr:hypothetical protein [Oligoflexia bacterium]MBF0365594.1 hypothetical protein [Oligoflexia bacterium]
MTRLALIVGLILMVVAPSLSFSSETDDLCPIGAPISVCVKQLRAKIVELDQAVKEIKKPTTPVVVADPNALVYRRLSVFSFIHPAEGYPAGSEWKTAWYHLFTPVKNKGQEMFRYDLHGYSYAEGMPLDLTWVGYYYFHYDDFNQQHALDRSNMISKQPDFKVSMYTTKKGFLVLKFGPISRYHNSFTLDYQSGSNGPRETDHSAQNYRAVITDGDVELKDE